MNIPVVICCPFFKSCDFLTAWRALTPEAATRDSLSFYRMQMSVNLDRLSKACGSQQCCVFGCREIYQVSTKTLLTVLRIFETMWAFFWPDASYAASGNRESEGA